MAVAVCVSLLFNNEILLETDISCLVDRFGYLV